MNRTGFAPPPRFLAPLVNYGSSSSSTGHGGPQEYVLGPPVLSDPGSTGRDPRYLDQARAPSPSTPIAGSPSTPIPLSGSSRPSPNLPSSTASSSTGTFPSDSIYHRPAPPTPRPQPERSAIRIWCTSWNMGDALPKGKLEDLFGPVPVYVPPEVPIVDFPSLMPGGGGSTISPSSPTSPHDSTATSFQPPSYHIIIISTQETPTPSGVPRGLAAGVTKGLIGGGQKEKERSKEKEWRREVGKMKEEMKSVVGDVVKGIGLGTGTGGDDQDGVRSGSTTVDTDPRMGAVSTSVQPIPTIPGPSHLQGKQNHRDHEADSYLFPTPPRAPFAGDSASGYGSSSLASARTSTSTLTGEPDSLENGSLAGGGRSIPLFPAIASAGQNIGPQVHPIDLASTPNTPGPFNHLISSLPSAGSNQDDPSPGIGGSVGAGIGAAFPGVGNPVGPGMGGVGGGGGGGLGNRGWSDILEDYFCHGIDEPLNSQDRGPLSAKPSLSRKNSRIRTVSGGSSHHAAFAAQHGIFHSHSHSMLHLHHPVPTTPSHLHVLAQRGGPEHGLGLGFVPSEHCEATTPGMSPSTGMSGSTSNGASPVDKHGPSFAAGAKITRPDFRLQQPPGSTRDGAEPPGPSRPSSVRADSKNGTLQPELVTDPSSGGESASGGARYMERVTDTDVDVHKALPTLPDSVGAQPTVPAPSVMHGFAFPKVAPPSEGHDHLAAPQLHGSQIPRTPSPLRQNLTPLIVPPPMTPMSELPPDLSRNKSGPYHFLVKERLLGLYVAVFIHKDCLDWVEGYDHDYVPAGLVGGRVGNKGGLGISLKMAGHRFLFVNSHLAAHTGKLDARLANVKKIKAELQLDTFLPEGDPRSRASDITDKFDTCLWMGDLNFRLEVSRLHADWLVSRKEYAQALEFDQLRKVQKNGTGFANFSEAPIDFPPTFKYDVWHSAKRTRSIQRKKDAKVRSKDALSIKEDIEEEHEAFDPDDESEGASLSDRRGSLDSQKWFSSSLGSVHPEAPIEEDDEEDDPVTVQQPGRPIAAVARTSALKAKSRFLKFVKGNSMPSSHEGPPSHTPRLTSPLPPVRPLPTDHMLTPPTPGFASPHAISPSGSLTPSDGADQPASGSPTNRPNLSRNLSTKLRRKMSGKNMAGDSSSESSSDDDEDNRAGVYDTSNKQRVPSWCDRVLWKSVLYPPDYPVDLPVRPRNQGHPIHRLSLLFAQRAQRRNGDRRVSAGGSSDPIWSNSARTAQSTSVGPAQPERGLRPPTNRGYSVVLTPSPTHTPGQDVRHLSVQAGNVAQRSSSPTGRTSDPPLLHRVKSPRDHNEHISGAKRWFHNLPALLTHHSSTRSSGDLSLEESQENPLPDHRKGEVECIKYGTIDDEGMKRLEGRSDHRPILFAANVYV